MNYSLIKKIGLAFFVLTCVSGANMQAQQTAHNIILDQMNYLLQLPEDYQSDTTKLWPMMVFLHGGGEWGTDVEKVKWLGPPRKIEDGHKYPFIVVSPQSPEHGWRPDFVRRLTLDLQDRYRVDKDRTYLTGLSMGGFGTWRTAQSYPELFAAIVPICGGGDTYNVHSLENMPIWCFHGEKDDVIPISRSQEMIDSLKQYDNPNVKFTIYPDVWHDSWTETYNNEDVYTWMLSHTRFKYQEESITTEQLDEYTGGFSMTYSDGGESNFTLLNEEGKLKIEWNEEYSSTYMYAGKDKFFMDPSKYEHIKFNRDNKNKIIGFTMMHSHYKSKYHKK